MTSRRDVMKLGAGSLIASAVGVASTAPPAAAQPAPGHVDRRGPWRRGIDGQRRADLGDGRYINPVFAGDHPDPTVLKDGADYYASFASGDYGPGPLIWHSRDLLNWTPLGPVLTAPLGAIHAPELVRHRGRYFLYMAVAPLAPASPGGDPERRAESRIFVVHAADIRGPWSVPTAIGVTGRGDPGHVVGEDGKRYLFLDGGHLVRLSDDGLKALGEPKKVYDGWRIPPDMINEGFSLDAAKIVRKDGFFYLFASEAGPAGPANGHLVSVARARTLTGPWENAPHNPLVRADARDDPWWSRGRAVPVEGPDGRWWIVYHAYEKNLRSLGRQTILEPIEWGEDGWPRALGGILDVPLASPVATPSASAQHGTALAGPFALADFGQRFAFFRPGANMMNRVSIADGTLRLKGQGEGPADASPLAMIAGDRRYDMSVEIAPGVGAEAGLLLFYDNRLFCGLAARDGKLVRYKLGALMSWPPFDLPSGERFCIRLVYKEDIASFYWSAEGKDWTRVMTFDVAGYNHNMAGGLASLRPALFVAGNGDARFAALAYNGAI